MTRPERKTKPATNEIASDIVQGVKMLDKPQASNPRRLNDGHEHQFILRDRCFWCGAPENAPPIPKREPEEASDE